MLSRAKGRADSSWKQNFYLQELVLLREWLSNVCHGGGVKAFP